MKMTLSPTLLEQLNLGEMPPETDVKQPSKDETKKDNWPVKH